MKPHINIQVGSRLLKIGRRALIWGVFLALPSTAALGQRGVPEIELAPPSQETRDKVDKYIGEILEPDIALTLDPRKSKLVRTKRPVARFSVMNPEMIEMVQYGPTEFELLGLTEGQTTLTLWFSSETGKEEVLRYLINVETEPGEDTDYGELQDKINEMFPNSMIQLIPIADKLLVRGQARDAEEATEIMAVIRGQTTDQTGAQMGPGSFIVQGSAAAPNADAEEYVASQVISMLDVPGEQQVMLKVRVAELTRSALRQAGANLRVMNGDFTLNSPLGVTRGGASQLPGLGELTSLDGGVFSAVLSTDDVTLSLQALSANGYSKILAEPNLVTLSGKPASFIAGGEFAVPTVVGVEGVGAATTTFRGFGTQLTFTPTVLDKDRIRLFVAPSFSTLNQDNTVNGIPGLNSRAVTTTVDLREGQWLAIAGLIQDQQSGSKVRVPLVGDVPLLDAIFSRRNVKRDETELLILVSPELIHPMEPEEAPLLLPGMEVTEPGDWDFFAFGYYEGRPNHDHRSTVRPLQKQRIWEANRQASREAKSLGKYERCEKYYVHGEHGFSR